MFNPSTSNFEIGVISDTHGLLRPEVLEYLKGCHYILHAGAIGKEAVLEQLKAIAPTFSVRENVDKDPWARKLPVSIGRIVVRDEQIESCMIRFL